MDPSEPHRRHVDDVVAMLQTDVRRGLTDAEVRSRLERYGRNELATEKGTPAWRLIEEGDTIPADGRLLESAALQTAEAALTGESLPVSKDIDVIVDEVALGDRHNMVFSGTAATYGHGKAVVTATGMHTAMGRIAGLLKETRDEPTPLQRELDRTGKLLGMVVSAIAVVVIATIIIVEDVRGLSAVLDVLILGVALAVAAVPEGLPAVVTAMLAIGVQRMARRNAIVVARNGRWTVQGDPTEGALLVAARKAGLQAEALEARLPRVSEVPFSSERKLMSTLHRDTEQQDRGIVFTKGAPDVLLTRCSRELVGDERRALTPEGRAEVLQVNDALTSQALRTLGDGRTE